VRKIVALVVVVIVVVAAWTGGWFYLRGRLLAEMDRSLADLASKGAEIACPDRSATGWPFRMEIACVEPVARFPDGTRVGAAAFAATWHVVDPKLVVAALKPPLVVDGPTGERATLAFEQLRASLRSEDLRTGALAVEAEKPGLTVAAADGTVAAEGAADVAEIHVRPTPDTPGSWDLAVTAWALTGRSGEAAMLPAPADAGIDLSVSELRRLGGGTPAAIAAWSANGGAITLREATLVVGETRISAAGTVRINPDGTPTATLDATATRIDWLTKTAQAGTPLPPALAALGSAFLLLGRPLEGEGAPRALTVAVEEGAVSANGLSIGQIPPLLGGGS
jgi:hypothetical protein